MILVFDPTHVFSDLYKDDCADSWALWGEGNVTSPQFCDAILAQFALLARSMNPVNPSANIRRRKVSDFFRRWGGLYSTTSCFVCLNRAPEHMLACRHAMCDDCVVIFGSKAAIAEYHYSIMQCPICSQEARLTVRQLPPTKGPNILSLDGGGVRGIVQLGLLRSLEKRLGQSLVARFINLCGGTSAGMLDLG